MPSERTAGRPFSASPGGAGPDPLLSLCPRFCAGVGGRRVAERILSRELCDFYAANGDLIVYPACTGRRSGQEADYALCPSAAWLEHLSHVDFYRLYCTKLPSAIEFAYA